MQSILKMRTCFLLLIFITCVFAGDIHAKVPKEHAQIAETVGAETGVPAYIIIAVMKCESDFDPQAISKKGAVGLMQVLPETAEEVGIQADELFDPYKNILAGSRYLKKMHNQFGDWGKAFAAYYIGPGKLGRNELTLKHWSALHAYMKGIQKYIKIYRLKYNNNSLFRG